MALPPLQEQAGPGFPPLDPGQASVKTSVTERGKRGPAGLPGPRREECGALWTATLSQDMCPGTQPPSPPAVRKLRPQGEAPRGVPADDPSWDHCRHQLLDIEWWLVIFLNTHHVFLGKEKGLREFISRWFQPPAIRSPPPAFRSSQLRPPTLLNRQTVPHHSLAAWLTYRICEPTEWGFCTTEPWNNLLRSIRWPGQLLLRISSKWSFRPFFVLFFLIKTWLYLETAKGTPVLGIALFILINQSINQWINSLLVSASPVTTEISISL